LPSARHDSCASVREACRATREATGATREATGATREARRSVREVSRKIREGLRHVREPSWQNREACRDALEEWLPALQGTALAREALPPACDCPAAEAEVRCNLRAHVPRFRAAIKRPHPQAGVLFGDLSGLTLGIETTPKSHHHRVIPMARDLRQSLERARDASRRGPWDPVALAGTGKPWGEYGLNQAFKRVQRRAKRSGWTFHSLRHFFVSELFRCGANAAAIQRLAGHADLATTQLYADVDASDLRAAIERIDGEAETSNEDGGRGRS
jgi:hypothetical protein